MNQVRPPQKEILTRSFVRLNRSIYTLSFLSIILTLILYNDESIYISLITGVSISILSLKSIEAVVRLYLANLISSALLSSLMFGLFFLKLSLIGLALYMLISMKMVSFIFLIAGLLLFPIAILLFAILEAKYFLLN